MAENANLGASPGPFVLDYFENEAATRPEAPAIALEDGRVVSYGELNARACELSRVISYIMSICPPLAEEDKFEDGKVDTPLVALMMDRDLAFIASMLATLKAEAGYVPVDPTFPSDRQSYIFEQSKCQCLLIDMDNFEAAKNLGVTLPKHVICLDSKTGKVINPIFDHDLLPAVVASNLRQNDPYSLAYILYTSGSTGKPKGVMVKNAGVVNQINWFAKDLGGGRQSKILGLATFCFDISVLEIFLPLTRGGLLVLAKASTQKDPYRILDLIKEHSINFFQATPTTYDMMFAIGWQGDKNIDFLVGGEAFRPSLLPAVRNCRSFRNVYGPTETTVWASSFVVPSDFGGSSIPPVGSPGPGYVFRVIDHQKGAPWREVERGQEGELWIGGDSVGRGYLRRPDLTKEVYLPDTFSGHGLIYRTGDLVKLLPDGVNYQFIQRIDNQVKIDGFRIELQEIENVYILHPLVEQAVALVKDKKLVIYIKPTTSQRTLTEAQQDEIHEFAKRSLMYYMIPKATVIVERFSLTATSKIDRKALPEPQWPHTAKAIETGLAAKVSALQPPNMVSHILNTISKTTGTKLGANSSFATMGVDSLAAVIFVKELSDSIGGMRIDPKKIFSPAMTVKRFSEELQDSLLTSNPEVLISLRIARKSDEEDGSGSAKIILNSYDENFEDSAQSYQETKGTKICDKFSADCVASNLKIFEGLRGLFTAMVLAGHFFYYADTPEGQVWYPYTLKGDVYFFLIMSGFTTSLQLRQAPKFSLAADGKRILLPRDPLNWKMFLITRTIGVLPILWLALILYSPVWYKPDLYPAGTTGPDIVKRGSIESNGCAVLYVIGLQSWYRPTCHYVGPNNCVYASAILNIFIIYIAIRMAIIKIQDYLMALREDHFMLPHETDDERDQWGGHKVLSAKRTWPQWLGNVATLYAYNRVNFEQAVFVSAIWFVIIFFIVYKVFYDAAFLSKQTQNAISYLPYFLMGCVCASLVEVWHCVLFGGASKDTRPKWRQKLSSFVSFIYRFGNDLNNLDESTVTIESTGRPGVDNSFQNLWLGGNGWSFECGLYVSETCGLRCFFCYCSKFFWRFLPDLLVAGSACIVLGAGWMKTHYNRPRPQAGGMGDGADMVLWFIGMPIIVSMYIFIVCLAKGSARFNFSRLVFESPVFTFMGFCSYPTYILQAVFFEYYAPQIYYSHNNSDLTTPQVYRSLSPKEFKEMRAGGLYEGRLWFKSLHYGIKVCACVILIVMCWFIQKYVQGMLVSYLYSRSHAWLLSRATKRGRDEPKVLDLLSSAIPTAASAM